MKITIMALAPLLCALLAGCGDDAASATSSTTSGSSGAGGGQTATSIADARALADQTSVTVEGYVTVPPGTFASATSEKGFAIQDDSAGIYVSTMDQVDLALGKKVQVTGKLGDMNKLRTLTSDAASIKPLDGTKDIAPEDVKTSAVGEATEGRLVRVTGTIKMPIADDTPYGYKVYIDDGSGLIQIFLHVSAGLDPAKIPALKEGSVIKATGLSAQYEADYEVNPRSAADIVAGP